MFSRFTGFSNSKRIASNVSKMRQLNGAELRSCSIISATEEIKDTDTSTTVITDDGLSIKVDRRSKFAFYLDNDVRRDIQTGKYKGKHHPGKRNMVTGYLPENLLRATDIVLEEKPMDYLLEEVSYLQNYIWDRMGPLEHREKDAKIKTFVSDIKEKESVDPNHPAILEIDRENLLLNRHKQLTLKIKQEIYNYKPMDFSTETKCLVYMMTRLHADYFSLVKVLSQLQHVLPHFVPKTVLDFGSGVGSTTWAVDKVWHRKCNEVINVDASEEMNVLNEKLQKGGTLEGQYKERRNSTYFRRYLPASATIKHDLIVSSRSLFELSSRDTRLRTLDILWKTVAPGGCLVLVEKGNQAGSEIILEAREFLLEGLDVSKAYNRGKVIAPCPHQMSCPLNAKVKKYRICSDSTKYFPPQSSNAKQDVFSYVIFQKSSGSDADENGSKCTPLWPRVVQPVLRPSQQTILRVCNKYGALQELSVTKGKHGVLCGQVAKATEHGDVLPVTLLPPSQVLDPIESLYKKKTREAMEAHNVNDENIP